MRKQLSDEQADFLIREILKSSAAEDNTVEEAATSPTVWWGIQRQITRQTRDEKTPLPPIEKLWRMVLAGIPVASAAMILAYFTLFPQTQAEVPEVSTNTAQIAPIITELSGEPSLVKNSVPLGHEMKPVMSPVKRSARTVKRAKSAPSKPGPRVETERAISSDFIALSYAREPESGQVVKVKVPSMMMVTLGLVASVEKTDELIDAEVIIGDDGLTRAIRFISR